MLRFVGVVVVVMVASLGKTLNPEGGYEAAALMSTGPATNPTV
jgi:hypothetical protein